jgi:hypothetical protein
MDEDRWDTESPQLSCRAIGPDYAGAATSFRSETLTNVYGSYRQTITGRVGIARPVLGLPFVG